MAPTAYMFFLCFLFLITTQSHPTRPFEFIRNLTEGQKGKVVPLLSELKQYLQRFGYLNSEPVTVDDAGDARKDANKGPLEDYFDDVVEGAIKAYQLNYNLPVTGTLDPRTVRQMTLPRCGIPDVFNRIKASFQPGDDENPDHDRNLQLIHGVSNYSFFPQRQRWNKYQLTYRFVPGAQVPGTSNMRAICARAFQKWASVTRFTLTDVPGSFQSDVHIWFFRGSYGENDPFDGNGGTLAHAYASMVGWFHYNADEYWSKNPNPNFRQTDLESVAVHEIGHLPGLYHSNVRAASMYPTFNYGERRRDLDADDI